MVKQMLKLKNFRWFFLSEIFYCFAIGMGTVGANWVLVDTTGSAQLIGLLLTVNVLAGFFASPFIGVLTDRLNRKLLLLTMYAIQIVLLIFLAILMIFNDFYVLYVFFFSIINGLGWTTYMATSRSLMQELLSDKQYIEGNAIVEISLQVGMFTAGAVSGMLYEMIGFDWLLIANAIAIFISSICLASIQYQPISTSSSHDSFIEEFKEGLSYLKKEYWLLIFGIASILPSVSTMLFNVVLPSYVTDVIKGNSIVFGLSDMFYGIGGFLSGFIASWIIRKVPYRIAISSTFLIIILILSSLVFNETTWILYWACLLFGFGNSSLRIWMNAIIMKNIPKIYLGRAISVWTAVSLLLQAILSIGLGRMMDQTSANLGFVCLVMVMALGLFLAVYSNRKKDSLKHNCVII